MEVLITYKILRKLLGRLLEMEIQALENRYGTSERLNEKLGSVGTIDK